MQWEHGRAALKTVARCWPMSCVHQRSAGTFWPTAGAESAWGIMTWASPPNSICQPDQDCNHHAAWMPFDGSPMPKVHSPENCRTSWSMSIETFPAGLPSQAGPHNALAYWARSTRDHPTQLLGQQPVWAQRREKGVCAQQQARAANPQRTLGGNHCNETQLPLACWSKTLRFSTRGFSRTESVSHTSAVHAVPSRAIGALIPKGSTVPEQVNCVANNAGGCPNGPPLRSKRSNFSLLSPPQVCKGFEPGLVPNHQPEFDDLWCLHTIWQSKIKHGNGTY